MASARRFSGVLGRLALTSRLSSGTLSEDSFGRRRGSSSRTSVSVSSLFGYRSSTRRGSDVSAAAENWEQDMKNVREANGARVV